MELLFIIILAFVITKMLNSTSRPKLSSKKIKKLMEKKHSDLTYNEITKLMTIARVRLGRGNLTSTEEEFYRKKYIELAEML